MLAIGCVVTAVGATALAYLSLLGVARDERGRQVFPNTRGFLARLKVGSTVLVIGLLATFGGMALTVLASLASSREANALLTGGDSYAYVAPTPNADDTGSNVPPLSIINAGRFAMKGVGVKLLDLNAPNPQEQQEVDFAGDIPAGDSRPLRADPPLRLGTTGGGDYILVITADNRREVEMLDLYRGRDHRWEYGMSVIDRADETHDLTKHNWTGMRGLAPRSPSHATAAAACR